MMESAKNKNINNNYEELSIRQLDTIQKNLKKNWPRSIFQYGLIENYKKWDGIAIQPFYFQVYGFYVGDTYEAIAYLSDQNYIVCLTEMNQMESFLRVFEIKEIDWNNGPTFGTLRRSTQEVPLKQAIKYCNYDIEWDIPCIGHYLEHRKALEFDIRLPDDIKKRKLRPNDSKLINDTWPYAFDNSESFVEDLINYNGGIALEKNKKPIAWITQNNYGALAIVNTVPECQGCGYGSLVSKAMCKQLAEQNDTDISAATSIGNVSEHMFRKLGFKKLEEITWIKIQKF